MKGDIGVLEGLNRGLSIELTSINQYFVQARVCKRWGYNKLAEKHYTESIEEMRHAEKLIDRIVFLGRDTLGTLGAHIRGRRRQGAVRKRSETRNARGPNV